MKSILPATCAILSCTMLVSPIPAHAGNLATGVACDVTADGNFDCLDLIRLQRWLLNDGTELNSEAAEDVNADGVIDIYDLALMKRILIYGDIAIPETSPLPVPYVFTLKASG